MTKCVPSCRPLGPGMACTSPAGLGTTHAEPWPMFFLLKSVCSPPLGPPPLFEMPTPRNVKGTPLVAKGPHQTRRTSTRWLPKQLFFPCSLQLLRVHQELGEIPGFCQTSISCHRFLPHGGEGPANGDADGGAACLGAAQRLTLSALKLGARFLGA